MLAPFEMKNVNNWKSRHKNVSFVSYHHLPNLVERSKRRPQGFRNMTLYSSDQIFLGLPASFWLCLPRISPSGAWRSAHKISNVHDPSPFWDDWILGRASSLRYFRLVWAGGFWCFGLWVTIVILVGYKFISIGNTIISIGNTIISVGNTIIFVGKISN